MRTKLTWAARLLFSVEVRQMLARRIVVDTADTLDESYSYAHHVVCTAGRAAGLRIKDGDCIIYAYLRLAGSVEALQAAMAKLINDMEPAQRAEVEALAADVVKAVRAEIVNLMPAEPVEPAQKFYPVFVTKNNQVS